MDEIKSLSEEVRKKIIEPIVRIDNNGNKFIREEDLASLNLDANETLFVRRLLSSDGIDFRKEGTITEEDRSKKVSEYNYGEVAGNDMEHLDRPKIATIEYKGKQLVFEDYEELDKFIEEVFLPETVQMKTVHSPDGNPYPSVQFNKIVKLGLSEKELKHVLDYLEDSGIRVGGKSQDLEGESKNYDYVHNYHYLELPESKSSEEVLQMFFEYREMKDGTPEKEKMRNDIIECNMRLVPYVAYRLAYFYGVDLQELESYGYEALIKAVDRFDPSLGFMFSTYAVECLKGEMMRAAGEMNELPQYYFFEFNRAKKVVEEAMGKKFNPSDSEMLDEILDFLIERGKITEKSRKSIKNRILSNSSSYISFENFTDTWDLTVDSTDSRPTETLAIGGVLSASLRDVLETLTPREQKILELRFGIVDGKTRRLEEVAKAFNVTRERVRQIEAKALRKLRHPYRSRKLKGYLDGEIVSDILDVTNYPDLVPVTTVEKDVDTSEDESAKSR